MHRLLGVHVLALHEPGRIVGADGQQRRIDAGKARADLLEALEVSGVARVVDARLRAFDDEPAPQRLVGVEEPAPAPVLRGHEADAHRAHAFHVPPAELHAVAQPHAGDHAGARSAHRGHVVVIVVAVRHQRRVDTRQLRGLQRGGHVAADEARDALGKNGIDEQRHSLELHQPAGVPDPGDARRLARSGRAREQRGVGLDARHVGLGWAAAATAGQLVEHRPAEHVGAAVRARAVEVEEAHGSLDERRKSAAAICLLQFLAVNAPNENQKRKPSTKTKTPKRKPFSLLVLVARSRCSFSLGSLAPRLRRGTAAAVVLVGRLL